MLTNETSDPGRITVARDFRGLSAAELARRLGTSRQFVHQLESGKRPLPDGVLPALARELGFAPSFFVRPLPAVADESACSFRRRTRTTQLERRRIASYATLLRDFVSLLEQQVALPRTAVPRFAGARFPLDIEASAAHVRHAWGLHAEAPVDSVTRSLENAGIVVAEIKGVADSVDAFSWDGARPLVLRNAAKRSTSRYRFDLAHELGHLVLGHFPRDDVSVAASRALEASADLFASAFLLPRSAMTREFPRGGRTDWSALISLKRRWKVSLAATIRRGYDIGLIDYPKYRTANVYLRVNGWNRNEPQEPAPEGPELLNLATVQYLRGATDWIGLLDKLGCSSTDLESFSGVASRDEGDPTPTLLRREAPLHSPHAPRHPS
jgi:Zn-dependent peptidase ImmA (M78 family)/DNA-binding XRE family transcriptional regulator